jgi:hypothetical protein
VCYYLIEDKRTTLDRAILDAGHTKLTP